MAQVPPSEVPGMPDPSLVAQLRQVAALGASLPNNPLSGGSSVSPESASRALVAADDSKTLICTGSLTFTVPSGLPSGFGLSAKGTCTFNPGSGATVNDIRTTGSLTPWCALIQTGSNSYDVVGGKA